MDAVREKLRGREKNRAAEREREMPREREREARLGLAEPKTSINALMVAVVNGVCRHRRKNYNLILLFYLDFS